MIYLIILYCFITLLCAWTGCIFYAFIDPFNTPDPHYGRPAFFYLINGLILLTALAQWWVLFLPLTPVALMAICFLLLILTWVKRKTWVLPGFIRRIKPSALFIGCLLVFLFMILTLNAGPTIRDDTDSYHIQMVKWAQQYGTVPGIANLHLRFGFNCSWFISIALLSPHIQGINQYLVLNGLLSCWLCHYLLQKIGRAFSKDNTSPSANGGIASYLILLIALLIWPMIRGNAASANYDFITTCCIIALFIEGFFSGQPGPEWIVWPFYLFTVRILNAPLLLLTVFMLSRSSLRASFIWMSAGAFLIVPFIIRNVILSGYPLFPIWQLDPFSFDWKVSRPLVREISEFIKYFNRANGNVSLVMDKPFSSWVGIWHKNLYTFDRALVDLSLIAWTGWLVYSKKWIKTSPLPQRLLSGVLLVQLLIWLWTAPDPRFVYGPLLFPVFACVTLLPPLRLPRITIGLFLTSAACIVLAYTIRKTIIDQDYRNWLHPHPLPIPTTQTIVVDGIPLYIPDKVLNNWNPRCFDLQLPCLYHLNPYVRARGSSIRDGFRMEQQAGTQQMQGEYRIR
jgi:hypothetical protein